MIKKLEDRINNLVNERRQLKDELLTAISKNAADAGRIRVLDSKVSYLSKQSSRVEGLLDETIKQSNTIEELNSQISKLVAAIDEGMAG